MSSLVPSVVVTSAWVSPRVKIALPWVRGRTPASIQMSRISSNGARIRTPFLIDHLLAENALAQRLVILLELLLGLFVVFRQIAACQFLLDLLDQRVAFRLGMLLGVERVGQLGRRLCFFSSL